MHRAILEWFQDFAAASQISRVSQRISEFPAKKLPDNISGTPEYKVEFSAQSVATNTTVPPTGLWLAPTDEDDSGLSLYVEGSMTSSTAIPSTLSEAVTNAKESNSSQRKSLRDVLCQPISCTLRRQDNSVKCSGPSEFHSSSIRDETMSTEGPSNKHFVENQQKNSPCIMDIVNLPTIAPVQETKEQSCLHHHGKQESAARKSIREALQRRQAELFQASGRNKSIEPLSSPADNSVSAADFLSGRTRRVSELLQEAEARFDSKLKSIAVVAVSIVGLENDDELLA